MKILQISITGKIFEGNLISRILKQNNKNNRIKNTKKKKEDLT